MSGTLVLHYRWCFLKAFPNRQVLSGEKNPGKITFSKNEVGKQVKFIENQAEYDKLAVFCSPLWTGVTRGVKFFQRREKRVPLTAPWIRCRWLYAGPSQVFPGTKILKIDFLETKLEIFFWEVKNIFRDWKFGNFPNGNQWESIWFFCCCSFRFSLISL